MNETKAKSDLEISKNKHRSLTTEKFLYILIVVVLVVVLLPPTVSTVLRRWPKLCCRYVDINIKTGQARYVRYLGYVKISEEVKDTSISRALHGEVIDVADIEPWHRVNTASPGVISPNYRFHSALYQTRQIELFGELNELGPEEIHRIAKNVLELWQIERRDFPVGYYLHSAFKEGMKEPEQD
jgi:hypothetical protein